MIMTFLNRLLKRLRAFFLEFWKPKNPPSEIDKDEIVIRGILHSLHVSKSKNKLKREAFLPPPGKKDVSVLRLLYTDPNFCKSHTKNLASNIPNQSYFGLATLKAYRIPETNVKIKAMNSGFDISIDLVSSPQEDLPMHADILYSDYYLKDSHEPKTKFRMIADVLIEKSLLFSDNDPNSNSWNGPSLYA